MDLSSRRQSYVARAVRRLADDLGFHPVAIARPELSDLARLGEHVLIRRHPDGFEQVIAIAPGDTVEALTGAADEAERFLAENPALARDNKLRVFMVGIGVGKVAGDLRKRSLRETRLLEDQVVVRRFFLSLDRRRLYAAASPWSFAPGFEINPCDPDENVFVELVRRDRYLEGPAKDLSDEEHRTALARDQVFLSGLTGGRAVMRTILAATVLICLGLDLLGAVTPQTLLKAGAKSNGLIEAGQYWRLVTPIFLHVNFVHMLVNMAGLYFLGDTLERIYGSMKFALIYFVSGIASVAASFELGPAMMVGASGAVFGLAGALVVYGFRHRARIPARFSTMFGAGLLPLIGINILFGVLVPGVDNWAHLGGLVSGALVALFLAPLADETTPPGWRSPSRILALALTGVVAGCVAWGAWQFFKGPDVFGTDAKWTLSRRIPGGVNLDIPATWAKAPPAAGDSAAEWVSTIYDARIEARAVDASKDTDMALALELKRLRGKDFHIVPETNERLGQLVHDLYTRARVDFRLAGPNGRIRQESLILIGSKSLLSIGIEFPGALSASLNPVIERISSSLPRPQ